MSKSKGPSISPGLFSGGRVPPPATEDNAAEDTGAMERPGAAIASAASLPTSRGDVIDPPAPAARRRVPRRTARPSGPSTPIEATAGDVDQTAGVERPARPVPQPNRGRAQGRRRPTSASNTVGQAADRGGPAPASRYERMHLYVTQEMKDQVHALQGHALTAGVPLGQRGASVVLAAALDVLLELSPSERLDVIRRRLQRPLTTRS